MLHSFCFGCGGPGPCQLNWFPSPCVCTEAAPAGEAETPETQSATVSRAASTRAGSTKTEKA